MTTNVIPGAEIFRFGDLVLHGHLQQVGTSDEQDVVQHRPLKRDGALVEGMGWQASRFEAVCLFVGDGFRGELERARAAILRQSEDVLVHPTLGRFRARCVRIASSLDVAREVNSATLTLSLVAAGLDQQTLAQQAPSVGQRAQALSEAAAAMELAAAIYSVATVAQAALLTAAAETYAASALAAMGGEPDPSLVLQVGTIEREALATIEALQADTSQEEDVDRWDAISAAQLTWSSAWEVHEALGQLRPTLVPHVVPQATGYLALMASLFGEDALDRESDFELWNPDLLSLHLIPAGTVVYLPPATV